MTSNAGLLRFQKGVRKVQLVQATVGAFKNVVDIPPEERGPFLGGFPKDLATAKEKEGSAQLEQWLGKIREWLRKLPVVGEGLEAASVKKLLEAGATSDAVLLNLEYAKGSKKGPPSVCLKCAKTLGAFRDFFKALKMYEKELNFYQSLNEVIGASGIPIPAVMGVFVTEKYGEITTGSYVGGSEAEVPKFGDDEFFCVVMEDLDADNEPMDQTIGITLDEQKKLCEIAANMHASFWEHDVLKERVVCDDQLDDKATNKEEHKSVIIDLIVEKERVGQKKRDAGLLQELKAMSVRELRERAKIAEVEGPLPSHANCFFMPMARITADNPVSIDRAQDACESVGIARMDTDQTVQRLAPLLKVHGNALLDDFQRTLDSRPKTLIHGDMRSDNWFRRKDGGGFVLIDWQAFACGPPGLELGQLLNASLRNLEDYERLPGILRSYLGQLYQKCPQARSTYTYKMLMEDFRIANAICFCCVGGAADMILAAPQNEAMFSLFERLMPRYLKSWQVTKVADYVLERFEALKAAGRLDLSEDFRQRPHREPVPDNWNAQAETDAESTPEPEPEPQSEVDSRSSDSDALRLLCKQTIVEVEDLEGFSPAAWNPKEPRFDITPLHLLCTNKCISDQILLAVPDLAVEDGSNRQENGWLVPDAFGATPVHHLCANDSLTKTMLRKIPSQVFADVWTTKDKQGRTPLHTLCSNESLREEVLTALVHKLPEKKADEAWLVRDNDDMTPFHRLCLNKMLTATIFNEVCGEVSVKVWKSRAFHGRTALHCLCRNESLTAEMLQAASKYPRDRWFEKDEQGDTVHSVLWLNPNLPEEPWDVVAALASEIGRDLLPEGATARRLNVGQVYAASHPINSSTALRLVDNERAPCNGAVVPNGTHVRVKAQSADFVLAQVEVGIHQGLKLVGKEEGWLRSCYLGPTNMKKGNVYVVNGSVTTEMDQDVVRSGTRVTVAEDPDTQDDIEVVRVGVEMDDGRKREISMLCHCLSPVNGDEHSCLLADIFQKFQPTASLYTAEEKSHEGHLDWLMDRELWVHEKFLNPLMVAARHKHVAWVDTIIDLLALPIMEGKNQKKHDVLHLMPNMRALAQLYDSGLAEQAVRLVRECGVRTVPTANPGLVKTIDPTQPVQYGPVQQLRDCVTYDVFEKRWDPTYGICIVEEEEKQELIEHSEVRFMFEKRDHTCKVMVRIGERLFLVDIEANVVFESVPETEPIGTWDPERECIEFFPEEREQSADHGADGLPKTVSVAPDQRRGDQKIINDHLKSKGEAMVQIKDSLYHLNLVAQTVYRSVPELRQMGRWDRKRERIVFDDEGSRGRVLETDLRFADDGDLTMVRVKMDDGTANWMILDDEHRLTVPESRAKAWESLGNEEHQQQDRMWDPIKYAFSVCFSAWEKMLPPTTTPQVAAEPLMFPIKDAALYGKRGLLHRLLRYTSKDSNPEIFGTQLVHALIECKWQAYGQALFHRETAAHIALVLSWQYVSVDAVHNTSPLYGVETNEWLAVLAICIALGIMMDRLVYNAACQKSLLPSVPVTVQCDNDATALSRQTAYSEMRQSDSDATTVGTKTTPGWCACFLDAMYSAFWLSLLVCPFWTAGCLLGGGRIAFGTVLMMVLATRSTKCEYLQLKEDVSDGSWYDLQRYVHVLSSHFDSGWNWIDGANLVLIWLVIARHRLGSDIGVTAQFMAAGTTLLWLRVIQYLNGFEVTASYVRMTFAIMSDMKSFMLILVILVVGNAFVLLFLYPDDLLQGQGNVTGWQLGAAEAAEVDRRFGGFMSAFFTSMIMFFQETELQLVEDAYSPDVATWHYMYYVVFLPLILLNLLIALMGGAPQLGASSVRASPADQTQFAQDRTTASISTLQMKASATAHRCWTTWRCFCWTSRETTRSCFRRG